MASQAEPQVERPASPLVQMRPTVETTFAAPDIQNAPMVESELSEFNQQAPSPVTASPRSKLTISARHTTTKELATLDPESQQPVLSQEWQE